MKILFYDGSISWWACPSSFSNYNRLDGSFGYTDTIKTIDLYKENLGEDEAVLTNSIVALDHKYGWNKKENHTDIYFYVKSKRDFVRCDKLTEKEIRKGHNIMKMFMNGAFDLGQNNEKTS